MPFWALWALPCALRRSRSASTSATSSWREWMLSLL
ncbi:MAG: hypothetical protein LBG81_01015 [Coriobacteriaceae bacterium]|nr:hypothetical protein [Coriobacteriaceae bacterium]